LNLTARKKSSINSNNNIFKSNTFFFNNILSFLLNQKQHKIKDKKGKDKSDSQTVTPEKKTEIDKLYLYFIAHVNTNNLFLRGITLKH